MVVCVPYCFLGVLLVQPLSVGDLLSILFCVLDLVVLFLIVCSGALCSAVFQVWLL